MDDERIEDLWGEGHSPIQIALETGYSVASVRKALVDLRLEKPRPVFRKGGVPPPRAEVGLTAEPFRDPQRIIRGYRILQEIAKASGTTLPGIDLSQVAPPYKLSYELGFGEGSPYSRQFPALAELPYTQRNRITREVLNRVVDLVHQEFGAPAVQRYFGPGGWKKEPINPSGQTDVKTADLDQIRDVSAALGYLAQQTEVYISRPNKEGENLALEIVEAPGGIKMRRPFIVRDFWHTLIDLDDKLAAGFLPLKHQGQSGIRIVNVPEYQDGIVWTDYDRPKMSAAIHEAAQRHGIHLDTDELRGEPGSGLTKFLRVDSEAQKNDWKENPAGEAFIDRIRSRHPSGVSGRLVGRHRQAAEAWVADALARHSSYRRPKGPDPIVPPPLPGLGPGADLGPAAGPAVGIGRGFGG